LYGDQEQVQHHPEYGQAQHAFPLHGQNRPGEEQQGPPVARMATHGIRACLYQTRPRWIGVSQVMKPALLASQREGDFQEDGVYSQHCTYDKVYPSNSRCPRRPVPPRSQVKSRPIGSREGQGAQNGDNTARHAPHRVRCVRSVPPGDTFSQKGCETQEAESNQVCHGSPDVGA